MTLSATPSWHAPEGLELVTRRWWHSLPYLGLLLLAAAGDAVNFTAALGVVAADQPLPVLVTAVAALTAAAVGLMHFAGISARSNVLAGGTVVSASTAALTALWLLLGLSSFGLRMQVPHDTSAAAPAAGFGATGSGFGATGPGFGEVAPATAAVDGGSATLLLALMMLALYLATGGMAAWGAYHLHNPDQAALRRSERARQAAVARLTATSPEVVRLEAVRASQLADAQREEERHAAALQACDAWAQELKEHARVRLAVVLGDPAASSALTDRPAPAA